jgi:S-formylglutathione hydrolase FrmB
MPYIEKTYRIRAEKRFRGIAGLSMGGFGTLNFAFKYPQLFAACTAFSASTFSEEYLTSTEKQKYERDYAPVWGPGLEGEKRLTAHYHQNNPYDITRNKGKEEYANLRIYIDCGDDDFLTDEDCRLHIHLDKLGIKHEFRMRDGIHNWSYWRSGLPVGLKFIGESFHQF